MNQHKYLTGLLTEFNYQHYSFISTPLDPFIKLSMDMGSSLADPSLYRRLVGKLNFFQHTILDIVFLVQHLSQFLQSSLEPHLLAGLYFWDISPRILPREYCSLDLLIFLSKISLILIEQPAPFLESLSQVIIFCLVVVLYLGKAINNSLSIYCLPRQSIELWGGLLLK